MQKFVVDKLQPFDLNYHWEWRRLIRHKFLDGISLYVSARLRVATFDHSFLLISSIFRENPSLGGAARKIQNEFISSDYGIKKSNLLILTKIIDCHRCNSTMMSFYIMKRSCITKQYLEISTIKLLLALLVCQAYLNEY